MASIRQIQEALLLCREAQVTPFIWGHRGLGKSSLVRQLAASQEWGFLDMRCSQMEACDLRGLPQRGEDGRTHFLPPADLPLADLPSEQVNMALEQALEEDEQYPGTFLKRWKELQPRLRQGMLFLDELNRARDDVLQASFQLVLDRSLGEYVLPPGWCVVAAGNFSDGYQVNGFHDPAFLNRFCHLILSSGAKTLEEWGRWMTSEHGDAADGVLDFAEHNLKHVDGEIRDELGFQIQPSRRSWDAVVRVLKAAGPKAHQKPVVWEVIAGLVGKEAATTFRKYQSPIKPREVIEVGMPGVKERLAGLSRTQLQGVLSGLTNLVLSRLDEDRVGQVVVDLITWLVEREGDKDLAVAFCRSIVMGDCRNAKTAPVLTTLLTNHELAQAVSRTQPEELTKNRILARLLERPALHQLLSDLCLGKEVPVHPPARAVTQVPEEVSC